MCNLSKGVEEKGIQKGIEKGIEQGIEKGILLSIRNLMETMGWSVEQAMESQMCIRDSTRAVPLFMPSSPFHWSAEKIVPM